MGHAHRASAIACWTCTADGCAGAQLDLWREHARKTLPVLMRATGMLVCGEDLGFLAPCVHPLMKELGLIGEPAANTIAELLLAASLRALPDGHSSRLTMALHSSGSKTLCLLDLAC